MLCLLRMNAIILFFTSSVNSQIPSSNPSSSSPTAPTGEGSTFSYTGSAQYITAPPLATDLIVKLIGGSGATNTDPSTCLGGNGAIITCLLSVVGGSTYQINVGGQGGTGTMTAAGWNGGGSSAAQGGGGGGASDIRKSPYTVNDRIVVAGGGGGCGNSGGCTSGGDGGYPAGSTAVLAGKKELYYIYTKVSIILKQSKYLPCLQVIVQG